MVTIMDQNTIEVIAEAVVERILRELPRARLLMTPEYLTAEQVAQMTGFSTKSLEAYRSKRQGPPFLKIGHSVRYRVDDVRAWMDASQ